MSEALVRNGKIYFTEDELRCKGSGLIILASHFGERLLDLREVFGRPMPVTSACRSMEHNVSVGGAINSYHICDNGRGCCAVDVRTANAHHRAELATVALNMGWSVGVHRNFLHLDRRTDYQPWERQLMFIY